MSGRPITVNKKDNLAQLFSFMMIRFFMPSRYRDRRKFQGKKHMGSIKRKRGLKEHELGTIEYLRPCQKNKKILFSSTYRNMRLNATHNPLTHTQGKKTQQLQREGTESITGIMLSKFVYVCLVL